jgi:predicted RNA-binding protein with PUA-like domain
LAGHFPLFHHITFRNMSSLQSRKDEILAKKAKLAELKKQRELRQKEFTSNRQSLDVSEVNTANRNRIVDWRLTDRPASLSYSLKGEAD